MCVSPQGFVFTSMGMSVYDEGHELNYMHYGGVISGVDPSRGAVSLWAPTYGGWGRGSIINLGEASGGVYDAAKTFLFERNVQKSHTAMVSGTTGKGWAVAVDTADNTALRCFCIVLPCSVCTVGSGSGGRDGDGGVVVVVAVCDNGSHCMVRSAAGASSR
jgi:hypothetical protein